MGASGAGVTFGDSGAGVFGAWPGGKSELAGTGGGGAGTPSAGALIVAPPLGVIATGATSV